MEARIASCFDCGKINHPVTEDYSESEIPARLTLKDLKHLTRRLSSLIGSSESVLNSRVQRFNVQVLLRFLALRSVMSLQLPDFFLLLCLPEAAKFVSIHDPTFLTVRGV